MKFRGRLLTKTWKLGRNWSISVDCAHANLHIVMGVKTDINHDVLYSCAEFERNRQSFRGPLSAKTKTHFDFSRARARKSVPKLHTCSYVNFNLSQLLFTLCK